MRHLLPLLFTTLLLSNVSFGATVSSTYSAGDIPTNNSSYSATCNGPVTTLTVNLPAGGPWVVSAVDVSYDMTAANGAWMSEQRSQIYCQNTTTDEGGYSSGSGNTGGTYSYSRTGLSLANNTYTGGTALVFEMRAYRTWTASAGCNTTENKVDNSTWTVTVTYTLAANMSYTSSTVTQNNTSDVEKCTSNAEIIGVEVVTSGSLNPVSLTQLRIRTNGSSNPTVDVSNIDVYYTGTSSTFATTTYYGSGTPAAPGTNIFINGSQSLSEGTNYFWIVYDIDAAASVGSNLDALCNRIRIDGGNQFPSTTNPGGNRVIITCVGSPGGVSSNLDVWHKAGSGVYNDAGVTAAGNGDGIQQWNDITSNNYDLSQVTSTRRPTLDVDGINYNAELDFDGTDDYLLNSVYTISGDMSYFIVAQGAGGNNTYHAVSASSGSAQAVLLTPRGGNQMRFVYRNGPSSGGGNDLDAGSTVAYGEHQISTFTRNQGSLQQLWINGGDNQSITASVGNYSGSVYNYSYGVLHPNLTRYLNGSIAEVVRYDTEVSATDRQKIETYLAVKYGITKLTDYVATSGSTIYSIASYANEIIGIARDDAESLMQKQSHTPDDSIRVHLSTVQTTNSANGGSITNDVAYIMMGGDNGALCATATANGEKPAGIDSRIERELKVTNTNFSDDFNVQIQLSSCAGTITVGDLRLLVDDDGDFSDATVYSSGGGLSIGYTSGFVTVTGISTTHIPQGGTRYITIGSASPATPLPVELLSLESVCSEDKVKVRWSTASEMNIAHYELEKSKDGVNWEFLTMVEAVGNSSSVTHYQADDLSPYEMESFYRLSEENNNGEKINLGISKSVCEEDHFKVFYNELSNAVFVESSFDIVDVKIYNSLGQIINPGVLSGNQRQLQLGFNGFNSGVYYVQIKGENKVKMGKVLVR